MCFSSPTRSELEIAKAEQIWNNVRFERGKSRRVWFTVDCLVDRFSYVGDILIEHSIEHDRGDPVQRGNAVLYGEILFFTFGGDTIEYR